MNENQLVSIVVPIYNVEKYLNFCIDSIVNQSYKNLEIILIDDESPDNCPSICEEWKMRDKRIRVIHKKNEGLGMARNTGLSIAKGKYICFFDSDDFVDENLIEKAFFMCSTYNLDIVHYGFKCVDQNGKIIKKYISSINSKVFNAENKDDVLYNLLTFSSNSSKNYNINPSIWGCMFSLDTIRKFKFSFTSERIIISEDIYSLIKFYKFVNKCGIIQDDLYNYRVNESSLTHIFRKDRFEKNNFFYKETIKLCDELQYSDKIKYAITDQYLSNFISALKLVYNSKETFEYKKNTFKKNICSLELKYAMKNINIKNESLSRKIFILFAKKQKYLVCFYLIKFFC